MAARPEEIAEGVYRLSVRGSNVYFVRSGSSWALIDAAWATSGQAIVAAAESLFGANTRPAAILLTHAHPDHSGSTLELAQKWDIPVYLHPRELPVPPEELSAAQEYPAGPLDRWVVLPLMRVLPARARAAARAQGMRFLAVARTFEPGAAVPGLPGWECIPTPGHSPGHVAYFRRRDRVLISGDALLTVNLNSAWDLLRNKRRVSGPPYISSWNWHAAKESVAALAKLEPRVLAPGHGAPIADDAASAVWAFADSFAGTGAVEGEQRAARHSRQRQMHEANDRDPSEQEDTAMSQRRPARSVMRWLAVGGVMAGCVAAAAYGIYAGITWWRYGRVPPASGDEVDALLDRFMPSYDVVVRDDAQVAAPAETTFLAASESKLPRSAIVRALFKGRAALLRGTRATADHPQTLLGWMQTVGWTVLAAIPGRALVLGSVTRPWEPFPTPRAVRPDEFAALAEPGYVKVVTAWAAAPLGAQASRLTIRTRVAATDAAARGRFRRYWAVFSPGILLIQRVGISLAKGAAERQASAAALPPPPTRPAFGRATPIDAHR
ncbi:MAG TPA: MBL fold metallo-hydrolase [Ktedonobacterales bacterium]|nr:MBL fold metallo-hydrolase [Ktedonobacterales bacterium]